MYSILDLDTRRRMIYDSALRGFSWKPFEGDKYILRIDDIHYKGPEIYDKEKEKLALSRSGTLSRKLVGTYRLIDKATGKVVSEKTVPLASVPVLTDRGTFVLNGNDWILSHQLRLKPGVYTRIDQAGHPVAQVNAAGAPHYYVFDPDKRVFFLETSAGKLPLITFLRALGVPEEQMRKAWGTELYEKNVKADKPVLLKNVYKAWKMKPGQIDLKKIRLSPAIVKRTLGIKANRLTPQVILEATRKLLKIYKGEILADDRDDLAYQKVVTPADIFREQLQNARNQLRKIFWKASREGNLDFVQPYYFQRAVDSVIHNSGLGNLLTEINPLEVLDQLSRITRMGKGSIESIHSIPDTARDVQPSYVQFIDPLHTPESAKIGADLRLAVATRVDSNGNILAPFLDKSGKPVWKSPGELIDKVISFPGELASGRKYVKALYHGELVWADRDKVDFEVADPNRAFGVSAAMIPLKSASYIQRANMGARMLTQAVPLRERQAPLVASRHPSGKSWEEFLGNSFIEVSSPVDGVVTAVKRSHIEIKDKNGKIHRVPYYNYLPYNRETYLHHNPIVNIGDRVTEGQRLTRSNWSDENGRLALGVNARVAYLPYKGYNFEDAIVISRSFADKLASLHAYKYGLNKSTAVLGKNTFVSVFPGLYDKETLSKYDEDGVLKEGEEVEPDQPLILALKQQKIGQRHTYADASIFWDKQTKGKVIDVHKTRSGIYLTVAAEHHTTVGDKLADRYGNKGVISLILDDDKMPRDSQGRPFDMLLSPLGIRRGNVSQLLEALLGKVAEKTGKPYILPDFTGVKINEFVRQELKKAGLKDKEEVYDPEADRKIPGVLTGT